MEVKKIYLDMDGVLADFDRGVRELCGMNPQSQNGKRDAKQDDLMWEKIREVDHFYDRLHMMRGAKGMFYKLWNKFGDKCEILTGIPKPHRGIVTAGEDKISWVRRALNPKIGGNIVFREGEQNFCSGPATVLIDDREKSIREWEEKGGTGILHTDPLKTIWELQDKGIIHYNAQFDDDPMWPVHWRQGEKLTDFALKVGFISEADIED